MASIVRNGLMRHGGVVTRRHIIARVAVRPAFTQTIRFNSSESAPPSKPPLDPEKLLRKQALERQDDLRRDWDAKVLSYDELVPITESPTPVQWLCYF